MVVTNGTLTKRFDEISEFPRELLERLFFKFSFHYLEFSRLGILDNFFNNVNKMKEAGASFTVEVTPSDELIPHIEDLKKFSLERLGALPHLTIARDERTEGIEPLTKYSFEEYKKIWGSFDSELFKYKTEIFGKKRNEFCYAGEWSAFINLKSGNLNQCLFGKTIDNIYKDITKPLNFKAIGNKCRLPHCYNGHLYLALGLIPDLQSPTYATLRNRTTLSGETWLKPKVESIMEEKLSENNEEYSKLKRKLIELEKPYYQMKYGLRKFRKNIKKKFWRVSKI